LQHIYSVIYVVERFRFSVIELSINVLTASLRHIPMTPFSHSCLFKWDWFCTLC